VLKDSVREYENERMTEFKRAGASALRWQEQLKPEIGDRTQAEANLCAIVEGAAAEIGERFFPSLVQCLTNRA